MDKPKSLSVKDFLIRKMSIKMNTAEKILDAVITHQFQSATQAMADSKSLEISGFGKFLFNDKKAVAKMAKLVAQRDVLERNTNDETLSEQRRRSAQMKLESVLTAIELLKPKIYDKSESNLRGVEE
jgi:nucleoid DNA-binding protein